MATHELTDKQLRFIDEYLKDLNATQACIRSGYSKANADKIGSELLGKTRVKEEIKKRQEKLAKKAGVTQEWIVEQLKKVYKRSMTQVRVLDKQGNFHGKYEFAHSGANKALELLGKTLGMYTDKLQHSGTITHEDALKQLE